jgi:hypothetical protein
MVLGQPDFFVGTNEGILWSICGYRGIRMEACVSLTLKEIEHAIPANKPYKLCPRAHRASRRAILQDHDFCSLDPLSARGKV